MGNIQYKDIIVKAKGYRVPGKPPTFFCVEVSGFKVNVDKVNGEAPSPLDYQLVSLAGCFNVVCNVVAREMGIDVEDFEVEVEGVFNPEKLSTGKGLRAGYKEIRVKVRVKSKAPREVLEKLIKTVEERCPIADNLVNPTPLVVTLEA